MTWFKIYATFDFFTENVYECGSTVFPKMEEREVCDYFHIYSVHYTFIFQLSKTVVSDVTACQGKMNMIKKERFGFVKKNGIRFSENFSILTVFHEYEFYMEALIKS